MVNVQYIFILISIWNKKWKGGSTKKEKKKTDLHEVKEILIGLFLNIF